MTIPDHSDIQNDDRDAGYGIIHRSLRGRLTAYEIAVYVALTWRADGDGRCWLRHKRLGEEAGCSTTTAQRTLGSLRDKGLVSWVPKYGPDGSVVCNVYTLHRPTGGSVSQTEGVSLSDREGQSLRPTERDTMNENPGTTNTLVRIEPQQPDLVALSGDGLFDEFWAMYPRKVGKGAARKAWTKVTKTTRPEVIVAGLERLLLAMSTQQRQYVKHPSTWLNAECWEDDPVAVLAPSGDPWLDLEREDALAAVSGNGYARALPTRHPEDPR